MEKLNDFQVEIQDVFGCPGQCPGCMLSNIERKSIQPDMSLEILNYSFYKLADFIKKFSNLEKIQVTYGVADHFLMSDDYLEYTFKIASDFIKQTNIQHEHNGIFYTASMIGKHENIMKKINFLHNLSVQEKTRFFVIAVLDPKNLYHKKFSDVYNNNIIETQKILKSVDLAINLSEEAIDKITPQGLYDFAKINHFHNVIINWIPTNDNIQHVYFNLNKLANWLIQFDIILKNNGGLNTTYRPTILRTLKHLQQNSIYENNFSDEIQQNIESLIFNNIQIDNLGNVIPNFEAIGDVPHSTRFNLKPIGNVQQLTSIFDMLSSHKNNITQFISKQFTKPPCLECSYKKICATSGFHVYNHILFNNKSITNIVQKNIKENNCPHVAKQLFDHYLKNL